MRNYILYSTSLFASYSATNWKSPHVQYQMCRRTTVANVKTHMALSRASLILSLCDYTLKKTLLWLYLCPKSYTTDLEINSESDPQNILYYPWGCSHGFRSQFKSPKHTANFTFVATEIKSVKLFHFVIFHLCIDLLSYISFEFYFLTWCSVWCFKALSTPPEIKFWLWHTKYY